MPATIVSTLAEWFRIEYDGSDSDRDGGTLNTTTTRTPSYPIKSPLPSGHPQLPYEEGLDSAAAMDNMTFSTEVSVLRNTYGADLVHLFGSWDEVCGEA